jgi:exonuclease V
MHAMTTLFDRIPLQSTADSSFPRPVTHQLKLLDNKTRRSMTLPSDRDILPSKIQLMLYHRLLTGLVSVSPDPQALDLRDFWSRVQVNPALTFSPQFCEESGLSIESTKVETEQAKAWSLNDLVQLWMALVSSLEIEGVETTLTLSYRSRESKNVKNQKSKTANQLAVQSTLEDIMMAQAIQSLQETGITDEALFAKLVSESIGNSDIGTPEPSKVDAGDTESTAAEEEAKLHDNVIGYKTFSYDESLLTGHLTRVFEWWHGLRPPRGVDIEDSGRCR